MNLSDPHSANNDTKLEVVDDFNYEDDESSIEGDERLDLCRYVQRLEREKRELKHHPTTQQILLQGKEPEPHSEMLQVSLRNPVNSSSAFQKEMLVLHGSGRERVVALAALPEMAQIRYEDAEHANESASCKLKSLQASRANTTSRQSLLLSLPKCEANPSLLTGKVGNVGEQSEGDKHDIEVLRRKIEQTEEQAAERQKMAASLTLHEAQLDCSNVLEQIKQECERQLNEWYQSAVVELKEMNHVVEKDRCSIRLQRFQVDDVLPLQNSITLGSPNEQKQIKSEFSSETLHEVLVRMQLEQVRLRRFEALKRSLFIRQAKLNQAAKDRLCHWKLQTWCTKVLQLNAVLQMHRLCQHFDTRKKLTHFNNWKLKVSQLQLQTSQAPCWNRMIAAERIGRIVAQITIKRMALHFQRWRYQIHRGSENVSTGIDADAIKPLQHEIKKLHHQLSESRAEAWRYKRLLLKQFL